MRQLPDRVALLANVFLGHGFEQLAHVLAALRPRQQQLHTPRHAPPSNIIHLTEVAHCTAPPPSYTWGSGTKKRPELLHTCGCAMYVFQCTSE